MLTRFLSISLLAVSSSLFGTACNRAAGGDPQPAAACEPPWNMPESGVSNPASQWDRVISGNPGLPSSVSAALRNAAAEEASAANPCVAIRERRAGTLSQEAHYGEALRNYQEALRLLDACADNCGDRAEVRRRINDKISLVEISLESVVSMNRRFLPVPSH